MSDDLTRAVAELHTAVTVEVRFYLTPRGSARSHQKARKDAFRV